MKRLVIGTLVVGGGVFATGAPVRAQVDLVDPATLPPPAPVTPAGQPLEATKSSAHGSANIWMNPNQPVLNAGSSVSVKDPEWLTPTSADDPDEWRFSFHGYLRAPMRISFGPPSPVAQPPNLAAKGRVVPTSLLPEDAPPGTQWHSWPRVPGASYITWEYTNTVPGPWAQLNFSYGNARTMMTVIVDSYAQTSGGYRDLQAQQGIDQAFITLNFPDLFGNRGGLVWNVGSFQNRYGTAGKYDGGMYETYLFGRTHVAGETLTANLEFGSDWALTAEQGLGAKMEVIPFANNQLSQIFKGNPAANCDNLRLPDPDKPDMPPIGMRIPTPPCKDNNGWGFQRNLSDRDAEYLPYAGPVPQGSTFLAHFHLGLAYRRLLTFGAHVLYTFTPDDNWSGKPNVAAGDDDATHLGNSQLKNVSNRVPRVKGPTRGSMLVTGGEVRLNGGVYGDGYLGYSYIDAKDINALADALEVLHSFGGWQFKQNFFGVTFDPHTGQYQGPQNETGTVQTIEGQYTFSFGALVNQPAAFWGQGPDLTLTAFGMLSLVNSPAPVVDGVVQGTGLNPAGATVADWNIKTKKLKLGADVLYTPLSWMGVGGRFDMVQPDLDAKFEGSHRNFEVLSPRVVLKTQFVTHEAITLTYQRYFVGSAARAAYPNEWVARPDLNLFALAATMWW